MTARPHFPSASYGPEGEVRQVDALPRQRHRDDWTVTHGYAVNLLWNSRDEWFFYRVFEAAWVFMRTARMGEYIEGDMYHAACETRFREQTGDHRTLYVGEPIHYWDVDEAALMRHFATLVTQDSKWPAGPGKRPDQYPGRDKS